MPQCPQCNTRWIESVHVCPKCKISIGPKITQAITEFIEDSNEIKDIESWKNRYFDAFVSGHKENSGKWEEEFFAKFYNEWIENTPDYWEFLDIASKKTQEIIDAIHEVENILKHGLAINADIELDFSAIKRQPVPPTPLKYPTVPMSPTENKNKYELSLTLLDYFSSKRRLIKKQKSEEMFEQAMKMHRENYNLWKINCDRVDEENKKREQVYKTQIEEWLKKKTDFEHSKETKNHFKLYCKAVLMQSCYPKTFPKKFDISFNVDNEIMVVDYRLPNIGQIPTLKEIKYMKSKDNFKIIFLPQSTQNALYDSLLYQIALRTIYELYAVDQNEFLKSVVFNGWIKTIDQGTGQDANICILSVQANRDEFLAINFEHVNPKECFKKLKGVGSSKLHGMAAIAPIIAINRYDKRFTTSYEVANRINEKTNIAAMDWKDFENLIRELFEKEFKTVGGEVKITQASRDEGVDAIAFDPDPIRGGKVVIQAKRYTNIVGVAAVRDLYGTVVNEGATKGILVTTTDYGPDAYKFAKDKPLTLLNGSNLLHLLEKHGHKAKIDISEAKKILSDS
jgi:restriction system protein